MLQYVARILSSKGLGDRWPKTELGSDSGKADETWAKKQPGSKTDKTQWLIRVRGNIHDDSESGDRQAWTIQWIMAPLIESSINKVLCRNTARPFTHMCFYQIIEKYADWVRLLF